MINKSNFRLRMVQILMLGIIIISSLIFINSHSQILEMNEEAQVWGRAFSVIGVDWSDYMDQKSLISFGYSLFLVPILILVNSAGAAYKLAIMLNVIFLAISYLLSLYVFYNLKPQMNKIRITLAAGIVVICPGFVILKSLALPYMSLLFLFWMILSLFISFIKKNSIWKLVCVGFVIAFGVWTHALMISVVIAIVPLIIILVKRKVFSETHSLVLGISIILFLSMGVLIEQSWNSWIFNKSNMMINSSLNNLISGIINGWLSGGIWSLLKGILGKSYALSVNTLLFYLAGLSAAIKYFKNKEWNKGTNISSLMTLYCIMTMVVIFIISSLYSMDNTYQESFLNIEVLQILVTPILIMGLFDFIESKNWKMNLANYFCVLFFLTLFVGESIIKTAASDIEPLYLGVINLFNPDGETSYYDQTYIITFVNLFIIFICCLLYKTKFKKRNVAKIFRVLGSGVLIIFCISIGFLLEKQVIVDKNIKYQENQAEITSLLRTTNQNAPIYYQKSNNGVDDYLPGLQFLLYDKQLEVINESENFNGSSTPYYLIAPTNSKGFHDLNEKMDILNLTSEYSLFTGKNSGLAGAIGDELNKRMYEIPNVYDNSLKLAPGTYEMSLKMQVEAEGWNGEGTVRIKSGSNIVGKAKVLSSNISNGEVSASVMISSNRVMGNMEISGEDPAGNSLIVTKAIYHKVSNKYTEAVDKPDSLSKIIKIINESEEEAKKNVCFVKGIVSENYDFSYLDTIWKENNFVVTEEPESLKADYYIFDINDKKYIDYMDTYSILYYNNYYMLMVKKDNDNEKINKTQILNEGKKLVVDYMLNDKNGIIDYHKPLNVMSGSYQYYFEIEGNTTLTGSMGELQIYNKDILIAEKEIFSEDINDKGMVSIKVSSKPWMSSLSYKFISNNNVDLKVKPLYLEIMSSRFMVGFDEEKGLEDFTKIINNSEKGTNINFIGNYGDKYLHQVSLDYLNSIWPDMNVDILTLNDIKYRNNDEYLLVYGFSSADLELTRKYTMIAQSGDYSLWVNSYGELMSDNLSNGSGVLTFGKKVPLALFEYSQGDKKNNLEILQEGRYRLTIQVTKKAIEENYQSLIKIKSQKSEEQIEEDVNKSIHDAIDLGIMDDSALSDLAIHQSIREGIEKETIYTVYSIDDKIFSGGDTVSVNLDVEIKESSVRALVASIYNINCDIEMKWLWIEKLD